MRKLILAGILVVGLLTPATARATEPAPARQVAVAPYTTRPPLTYPRCWRVVRVGSTRTRSWRVCVVGRQRASSLGDPEATPGPSSSSAAASRRRSSPFLRGQ